MLDLSPVTMPDHWDSPRHHRADPGRDRPNATSGAMATRHEYSARDPASEARWPTRRHGNDLQLRNSGTRRNGQDITVWVRSTVCLQQIDGQWLITHEHISFPINPENWSAIVDTTP